MKGDQLYLQHILDAIEKVESYISVGYDVFISTSYWQDAVVRHPEVPWCRIAGLRDVLIHDYMGVDIKAVWEITQKDLPVLKKRTQAILKELTGD